MGVANTWALTLEMRSYPFHDQAIWVQGRIKEDTHTLRPSLKRKHVPSGVGWVSALLLTRSTSAFVKLKLQVVCGHPILTQALDAQFQQEGGKELGVLSARTQNDLSQRLYVFVKPHGGQDEVQRDPKGQCPWHQKDVPKYHLNARKPL